MKTHTSTEFVEWCVFLARERWKTHTKDQHQLALIAYQVHRLEQTVACLFGGKPDVTPLEKFLLEFGRPDEPDEDVDPVKAEQEKPEKPTKAVIVDPDLKGDFRAGGGYSGINTGEPLDERWQKVNDEAKARWAATLLAWGVQPRLTKPEG